MDPMSTTPALNGSGEVLQSLDQKIAALSEQVAFLTEEARINQRRRQEWDELKGDLTPVATDIFRISVTQLEEVEQYVQYEDILRLFKRLLRNTRNLESMLDQLESTMELVNEVSPLSQDAFMSLMVRLDDFERKGYFTFLREGAHILDQIVTNFAEEDVRRLGDNIVLILETLKGMTQPEIMQMVQHVTATIQEEEPAENVSMLSLLRQFNDPAVKRGLSKTLTVLKTVSEN